MGLKKLFYGIFDAPAFQDFKRNILGIEPEDDSLKKDIASIDVKADEIKTDIGQAETNITGALSIAETNIKADIGVLDGKVVEHDADIKTDIGGLESDIQNVDAKVQSIIDNPPSIGLGNLPRQMTALTAMVFSLVQMQPKSIWMEVPKGIQNDVISIVISIHTSEIETVQAWGLDFHFDPSYFSFPGGIASGGIEKGGLCLNWSLLDGNELSPGLIRIGAAAGSLEDFENEIGSIVVVNLTVLNDGTTEFSNISIDSLIDGLKGYMPRSVLATFEYGQ